MGQCICSSAYIGLLIKDFSKWMITSLDVAVSGFQLCSCAAGLDLAFSPDLNPIEHLWVTQMQYLTIYLPIVFLWLQAKVYKNL